MLHCQSARLGFQISFSETLVAQFSFSICRSLYFASLATSYWPTQIYSSDTTANEITDSRAVHWSADHLSESKYSGGLDRLMYLMWPDLCDRQRGRGVTYWVSSREEEGAHMLLCTLTMFPARSAGPWYSDHSPPVCRETETARGPQVVHYTLSLVTRTHMSPTQLWLSYKWFLQTVQQHS